MDTSQSSISKSSLTGLFTMILENGKPYKMIMKEETLQQLGLPTDLSPEEAFYVWLDRVRAEDRRSIKSAINGSLNGIQSEVRYLWKHDTLGWISLSSTGVLTDNNNGSLTIKGFFKSVSSVDRQQEDDEDIMLIRELLLDVAMNNFSLCALTNIETNTIYFLRDSIFTDKIKNNLTYDEWREFMLEIIFRDDADKFRSMSARQKMPEYFKKYDGEYQIEVRYRLPNSGKYQRMRQKYIKFKQPLAGRFGEVLVFSDINVNHTESYKETLHRRLIDGLALPYREVDLVNLNNGRMYSSYSEHGHYTESFEEIGDFDEMVIRYFNNCDLSEEQRAANLDKFLTKNLLRHFSDGTPLLETEVRHKRAEDGEYEWVRIQAFQSAADEERNPYMAIVTVMLINEEKERELRSKRMLEYALRSERQYKQAILSTALAVYTFNVTTDTLYEEIIEEEGVKPLLPRLGLSVPCSYNEYIQRKSECLTVEQEAEFYRKTFNTTSILDMFSSKRFTFDYEYEFMIDDQKGVFREAVILTKDFETNEVWGLTCVRNITNERNENKRIEQALRDAFFQAQRANSAKTLFMSQMSHDIRTPLNSILGMAAIAREHFDDRDRVMDCMEKIDFAGRHLLEIINNVLDLSAIESGKTQLSSEDFDLGTFIDDTLNMIKPLADKRGHTLEVQIGKMHESVIGDRTKLRQLLVNVLGNAVKYTPNGGKIRFTAEELEPDRHDVCRYMFTVKDNGIGMSEEFIKKVFDPFSRADNRRIGNVQGTGLGMPIAQNIARMMNGDIRVTSEVGKGSEFVITVCLKRGDDHSVKYIGEVELEEPKKVRMSDYDFRGRRVLLAEDLQFNAEIAAEFLHEANIEVEFAANGAEAVRMFSQSEAGYYDLIFMDIQMPELDGYEATKQIRGLDKEDAATVPIVAMTANAFIDDIQKSADSGMNGHIAKPIEIPRLAQMLVRFFGDCRKK